MHLGAQDASPIANWTLEIREPQPPYLLFYRLEGRGSPAERTIWDGRSNRGELVQAATDYPVSFTAVDALGNSSTINAAIGVDVLVIRDGDRLRIQVPSIIFRENASDFNSLAGATVDNNLRVLRRIAEILNKFRDYKVQVEGHANPVLRTQAEESGELQPLSEARARAVVNMLAEFGVVRNRLSAIGMGGTRPVVKYEDHDNWWKNRRVEFILIK
jgi:outer membrane protein OmpA-like peptidoglycan-associated protein